MKTLALLALLCGCASGPPRQQVFFDSDPPGARVYLSYATGDRAPTVRAYMGQTPCTNRIPAHRSGELDVEDSGMPIVRKFVPVVAVITAELGTNTRQQTIRGDAMWKNPDLVPSAMFFDFTKPGR